jgi:hypothetical protein
MQGDRFEDFGDIKGLQQGIFMPQAIGSALAYGELEQSGSAVLNMPGEMEGAVGCHTYLFNELIVAHISLTSLRWGKCRQW